MHEIHVGQYLLFRKIRGECILKLPIMSFLFVQILVRLITQNVVEIRFRSTFELMPFAHLVFNHLHDHT